MARVENACAGPFGGIYDSWIERERVGLVDLHQRLGGAAIQVVH